jgi:hypothetical protein
MTRLSVLHAWRPEVCIDSELCIDDLMKQTRKRTDTRLQSKLAHACMRALARARALILFRAQNVQSSIPRGTMTRVRL